MYYLGIDPGKSGGIVLLSDDRIVKHIEPMPSTGRDIWNLIYQLGTDAVALVEWVHPAIQGTGKSSMSKLYGNYKELRMALIASSTPFEDVNAVKWQRAMGISPRKKTENQSQWKNRLKAKAQELFPSTSITLKTCDALLIAEYLRRSDKAGVLPTRKDGTLLKRLKRHMLDKKYHSQLEQLWSPRK
jgi:hypothetical protein